MILQALQLREDLINTQIEAACCQSRDLGLNKDVVNITITKV